MAVVTIPAASLTPTPEQSRAWCAQLEAGDILIDGGNSLSQDTNRRTKALPTMPADPATATRLPASGNTTGTALVAGCGLATFRSWPRRRRAPVRRSRPA